MQRSGDVTMRINPPWVQNINDVLALLQPSLAANPDLAADDYTRRYLENPAAELRPMAD